MNWLDRAKEAFDGSSAFVDTNYRSDWDYSIKAFRSEHASSSKYSSPEFAHRSRIFRPKTRSIIRKNEAAAAAALYSNMEVVNLTAGNPDDPMSVAGTAAMKEVLEFRLTKTIPSFEICMGGVQDAQTQGAVVSYQYWEHQVKNGKKIKDNPCVELRPIENIRLDGGASWTDPINTSPYLFDILPMHVCDVKSMMNSKDEKTGQPKWKKFKDDVIAKARPDSIDTTRQARLGKQQDPHTEDSTIGAFDVVWVMRVFMRDDSGDDYTFYTLGTEELLTDPKPLEEVYHHGVRPYVMGYAILETHKVFKTSVPVLIKPLQQETNDVANQRLDNVKFVLNKRWIVARGRQVDVQSLVRNVPGGVTLATDPKNDVQESNWPDVTSSAYVEQDRITADLDDIAGNFSPSTKVANNAVNDTLGGSKMAAMGAGLMTDYLLRTIIETWWEKVLRQLILLEQYYEDDQVVLAVCANKARLFPRFGLSQITDDLLMQEVHLTVNVGMGSSNPNERMQKFLMATQAAVQLVSTAPPGFNVVEGIKEIYSNAGYRDGARFFSEQQDPRLLKAMQMVQQLQGMLKGKQMEMQADASVEQMKLASNERIKGQELQVDYFRIRGDLQIRAAELSIEQSKVELDKVKAQIELRGADAESRARLVEISAEIEQAQIALEQEKVKLIGAQEKSAHESAQMQSEREKTAAELRATHAKLATALVTKQNEEKIGKVSDDVGRGMQSVMSEVARINQQIEGMRTQVAQTGQGLALVLGGMAKTKKPSGFKLKKDGGKTIAVSILYPDGTEEDMPVKAA